MSTPAAISLCVCAIFSIKLFDVNADTVVVSTHIQRKNDANDPITVTISFNDTAHRASVAVDVNKWTPPRSETFNTTNTEHLEQVESVTISNTGATSWRVELISLEHGSPKLLQFPLDRTLASNTKYSFGLLDAFLPWKDPFPNQRKREIENNRKRYEYAYLYDKDGIKVILVKNVPPEEEFSIEYMIKLKKNIGESAALEELKSKQSDAHWTSYQDILDTYPALHLTLPMYANYAFKTDLWFGQQRLQGINPGVLQRVTEIPENFNVTDALVKDSLEGDTLEGAKAKNKLFMVNFWILKDVRKDLGVEIPAPMALFYLNSKNQLMPIAIQLLQEKGPNNPVFTPRNNFNTWLLAKMFFNLADSTHHQGITHLGHIHYMLERVIIAAYRHLSPSHPIMRLMKPHFIYTISINRVAYGSMSKPDDNSAKSISVTGKGILYLTEVGINNYNMERDGNIHNLFKSLGTTKKFLKYYPYRDDLTSTYDIVRKYVKTIVKLYYKIPGDLDRDKEIQGWRKEMSHPSNTLNGGGLKGIPGSDEKGLTSLEQLIDIVTIIIHTASCRHAAINFLQYDYYGFPPNSPSYFEGPLPTTTDNVTEQSILNRFATRKGIIDIINYAKGLSDKQTNMLGNFEVPALYYPTAQKAHKTFIDEIAKFSAELVQINKQRAVTYPWGDPSQAPNAVSI